MVGNDEIRRDCTTIAVKMQVKMAMAVSTDVLTSMSSVDSFEK